MNSTTKKMIVILLGLVSLTSCFSMMKKHEGQLTPQKYKLYFEKPTEAYAVNKSRRTVSNIWKKQAKKCLNRRVTHTTRHSNFWSASESHTDSRANVRYGKKTTEFLFEIKMSNQIVLGMDEPEDGFLYSVMAETYSVGKNKTQVDVYIADYDRYEFIAKALKAWAAGKSTGCPDMTQQ